MSKRVRELFFSMKRKHLEKENYLDEAANISWVWTNYLYRKFQTIPSFETLYLFQTRVCILRSFQQNTCKNTNGKFFIILQLFYSNFIASMPHIKETTVWYKIRPLSILFQRKSAQYLFYGNIFTQ